MEKNAVVIYLLNSILDRSEVKSSLLAEGFQNLADQVRIPVTPYQQPRKVYWIHILIHNAVEPDSVKATIAFTPKWCAVNNAPYAID